MDARTLIVLALALVAALVDVRTGRIPNPFNLFVLTGGIALAFLAPAFGVAWPVPGPVAVLTSAAILALGLAVFRATTIGGGDVKLAVALGAWLGPLAAVEVLLYSTATAAGLVVLLALRRGRLGALGRTWVGVAGGAVAPALREGCDEEILSEHLPLGVAVFLGACLWVCVGGR